MKFTDKILSERNQQNFCIESIQTKEEGVAITLKSGTFLDDIFAIQTTLLKNDIVIKKRYIAHKGFGANYTFLLDKNTDIEALESIVAPWNSACQLSARSI
jgi:hypothetical protein